MARREAPLSHDRPCPRCLCPLHVFYGCDRPGCSCPPQPVNGFLD